MGCLALTYDPRETLPFTVWRNEEKRRTKEKRRKAPDARYYDPALGRFISVDPKASQFATMSPYLGMGANPNMYVDPDGQELTLLAAIAIGAAIGAGTYTASVGFSDGGFSNWNWGQFALGVGIGGLSGAAGFGVGEAFKGAATGLGTSVMKAGVHGITQGTISAGAATIQGGDATQAFLMGAASGAAGSAFGSAFGNISQNAGIQLGINAAGGALIGGAASAWAGGDFWEGAAIGATVTVANHYLHRLALTLQDQALINKYKKGEKIDLSRKSKMMRQIEKGARLAYLHTRGESGIEGNMKMSDIFDFESMKKPYSGWYKFGGAGLELWGNKSAKGLNQIVFQDSGSGITDIDLTNDGIIGFHDRMSSYDYPSSYASYNMTTIANQINFYSAMSFIYYGIYDRFK